MSDPATAFGAKLDLALRVLNISRAALAAETRVDKSLVSRWARGLTLPRGHNLAALTDVIRARVPGFNQLSWDLADDAFAAAIGGQAGDLRPVAAEIAQPAAVAGDPGGLAISRDQSRIEVERNGNAYPGLYVAFRRAFRNSGEMVGDLVVFWRRGGRLFFRQYDPAFSHGGEVLILHHQLFCVSEEDGRVDGLMFYILNGATGQKAMRLDGLLLSVANDRERTPSAGPLVLQRLDDLADRSSPPDYEEVAPIVARLTAAFNAGEVAALAGPDLVGAVTLEFDRGGGIRDHLLRQPASRGLSATDTEWGPAIAEDVRRVRRALLDRDDLFAVYEGGARPETGG